MADDNVIELPDGDGPPPIASWQWVTISQAPLSPSFEVKAWSGLPYADGTIELFCGSADDHSIAYKIALAKALLLGVRQVLDCTRPLEPPSAGGAP